jgi:mRNA-degrading endonuclease YafQ of YafQ-DinJ toxin-antitoxin module
MKEHLIFWSPVAEETYLKTLSQILERWTIKEAEDFEARVESLINRLKTQKRLCPPSGKQKNLRRCVIAPQTSLVYQIKDNIISNSVISFIHYADKFTKNLAHKFPTPV